MSERIDWYFDFISPFAYLQWPQVRELAETRRVRLRPILFAGLLDALGTKGPAEIPSKRRFTYRYVAWRARQRGIELRFPPAHPFNPLPALRLCVAAGTTLAAVDTLFDWIWRQGQPADPASLAPVAASLGVEDIDAALADPAVKSELRGHFDAALAIGVFGVPTLAIGSDLFWGEDATGLALERIADPGVFECKAFRDADAVPVGMARRGSI